MDTKGRIKKRGSLFLQFRSILLHLLFICLLCLMLSSAAALSLCLPACRRSAEPAAAPEGPAPRDSLVRTRIIPRPDPPLPGGWLDLAVYREDPPQKLEFQARSPFSDTLEAATPPGDKRVVLIANCPYRLNYAALQAYESIEQLVCRLEDELPRHPVMSGTAVLQAGMPREVRLEPLRGEVILVSVDNSLPAGTLLENPRVRLCNVSPAAELLRTGDFHPVETTDGEYTALPHAIGYFPVRPGIRLPCYPFDASDPAAVLNAARLEFTCEIEGTPCRYQVRLPSLQRGGTLCVELIISGPERHSARVYDGGPLRLDSP